MIVFTSSDIRPYSESDLKQLTEIYKAVFAEPPWNETWNDKQVKEDLELAVSQPLPVILVAEDDKEIIGFTWGYKLPFEKFYFLKGKVSEKASYIDEIAVKKEKRRKGIGTLLGEKYIEIARQQGTQEIVLRTDERCKGSMSLFWNLGFDSIPNKKVARGKVYDPQYCRRIYLRKKIGGENAS